MTGRALSLLVLVLLLPFAAAEDKLTLADLTFLLETEKDQGRIVTLVRQADDVAIEPGDLPALQKLGAGPALLAALREQLGSGSALTVQTVLRMLREKRAPTDIIDHILGGSPGLTLTARQKLDLRRAGADANIVRALEGRYVYPGFKLHVADHGLFSIQHPGAWRARTFYGKDGLHVILSPQDVKKPGDFSLGIDVQTIGHWPTRHSLLERHRRELPALLAVNRKYALEAGGEAKETTVDGRPAVEQLLLGRFRDEDCAVLMVRFVDEDIEFVVQILAPRKKASGLEPILRRALRTFRTFPGQKRLSRLRKPLSPTEAIERFRDSVVHVRALFGGATGFGSGFVVREDGYVLTNHHVVCRKSNHFECTSRSKMQLAPKFELVWDSRVGPKPKGAKNRRAPATLVGTVYQREPFIDLALLRLPRSKTPYRALPMCRAGQAAPTGLVKDGDPVLALGFPLPGRFGVDFLTPTQGAITRVDYRRESGDARVLDRIRATINIQKGNSGGPLVSLVTGGVVGLNTAGEAAIKGETRVIGEQLGHQLISPIDWALHHFPQLRYYPLNRIMPLEAHLELAEMLMRSNLDAAKAELDYVAPRLRNMAPRRRADYHYLRHLYARETNDQKGVLRELDAALRHEPRSFRTLIERVKHTYNTNEAIGFADRAVAVQPESPWGYYRRAFILLRASRYEEALEDVVRAKKNGGASQPRVWQLEGLLRYAKKDYSAGLAAYKESIRLDPTDLGGHFGVGEYYKRTNRHALAELEYLTIARNNPEDPAAQRVLGSYLASRPGKKQAALDFLERAIALWLKRGVKPELMTLNRAAQIGTLLGGRHVERAVRAGVLLSRHWPGQRRSAHARLGEAWEKSGRRALAYAHYQASDPTGMFGRKGKLKATPLLLGELDAAVKAQYDPNLFGDVLRTSSLGFSWSKTLVSQLAARKWQLWQIIMLRGRLANPPKKQTPKPTKPNRPAPPKFDLTPTTTLGRTVTVAYEGSVNAAGKYSPVSTVVFTNTGRTPVMNLQVRIEILRNAGGKRTVLGTKTRSVHVVLKPKERIRFRFAWMPWSEMKKLGIRRDQITHYSCSVVKAADAAILSQIRVTGAYRKDKSAYDYTVTNRSPIPLRNIQIRCDFVDKNGKPIPRDDGTPAHMWGFLYTTLQPGKSRTSKSTSWASWQQIRALGVKASTVNVRLVVAHAQAAKR